MKEGLIRFLPERGWYFKREKGMGIRVHKVGIISDTHGLLRSEVLEKLHGCEAIVHGGDINKPAILEKLQQIAPVYAVRGNNDKEWAVKLPKRLSFTLYGVRFFMVHNKKELPDSLADKDIVIYGHSHKYEEKYIENKLFLNPGSCGPRRFTQPVTMALLEIKDDLSFKVMKIEIPHQIPGNRAENVPEEKMPQNIRQIIISVMKDTDRGKSIGEIAKRNDISEELAEQICRLYLTHPGVDADGIMGKMGCE